MLFRLLHPRTGRLLLPSVAILAVVAVLTGCGSSSDEPVSAESSQYQVADGDDLASGGAGTGGAEAGGTTPVTLEAGAAGSQPSPSRPATSAGGGRSVPATGSSGAGTVQQPPSLSGKELNQYTVPDGTSQELLDYVANLFKREAQGTTNEELLADVRNMSNAAIEATDKILAAETDPQTREKAVRFKLLALRQLAAVNAPDIANRIRTFCQSLRQEENQRLARLGRMMLFGLQIGDLLGGNSNDAEGLLRELDSLLADREWIHTPNEGEELFGLTQQAAMALQQIGKYDESNAAVVAIGKAFADHENPEVARDALGLLEQPKLVKVDFDRKRDAALMDEQGAMPPFMAAVRELLAGDKPGPLVLDKLLQAGQYMEITQHADAAREIYDLVGQAYEGHENPELAEQAAAYVQSGKRRVELLGKPFVVEGVGVDGTPFDWSKYQGKVVLVDFWASWCGPCRQEFPNIAKYYELYRDKGFEVVGINLDEEPAQREQFFAQQTLPWTTVVSADPQAQGFENPMAVKCGIDAIPFLVLVNQQGIAVALHTRGEILGEKLAELLGPVEGADAGAADPARPETGTGATGGQLQPGDAQQPPANSSSRREADQQTWFVSLNDEPASDEESPADEEKADAEPTRNPYLAAPGLTPAELVDYLLDMDEKPQTIQRRPGFAAAVAEAADRVLAADASDKLQTLAATVKFRVLHDAASFDDQEADKLLAEFVVRMKDDTRPKIAQEVHFLSLERRALEVDQLPKEQVPQLLEELQTFLAGQKLVERHLRIASATVHAINRLDEDQREPHFQKFGQLFAASQDKELARYGKKLTKDSGPAGSELVGKPLELAGVTTLGDAFRWEDYRGKVVLVDFWATWCGPCRRAMPKVKQLHERLRDKPFDIVGVSLDRDLEALAGYLADNAIAWTNLAGEGTQDLARKYGVKGIPTMMLVNKEGMIVAVSHNLDELTEQIEKLLE